VTTVPAKPTPEELRRFIADCNTRRMAWSLFQKAARRSALRMLRDLPRDGDA
jgi:hypothetical protein